MWSLEVLSKIRVQRENVIVLSMVINNPIGEPQKTLKNQILMFGENMGLCNFSIQKQQFHVIFLKSLSNFKSR